MDEKNLTFHFIKEIEGETEKRIEIKRYVEKDKITIFHMLRDSDTTIKTFITLFFTKLITGKQEIYGERIWDRDLPTIRLDEETFASLRELMLRIKNDEDYDKLIRKYYSIHYECESASEDVDWIKFASD